RLLRHTFNIDRPRGGLELSRILGGKIFLYAELVIVVVCRDRFIRGWRFLRIEGAIRRRRLLGSRRGRCDAATKEVGCSCACQSERAGFQELSAVTIEIFVSDFG